MQRGGVGADAPRRDETRSRVCMNDAHARWLPAAKAGLVAAFRPLSFRFDHIALVIGNIDDPIASLGHPQLQGVVARDGVEEPGTW